MQVSKQNMGCWLSFSRSSSASCPCPEVCAVFLVASRLGFSLSVHANSCSQTCARQQKHHILQLCANSVKRIEGFQVEAYCRENTKQRQSDMQISKASAASHSSSRQSVRIYAHLQDVGVAERALGHAQKAPAHCRGSLRYLHDTEAEQININGGHR